MSDIPLNNPAARAPKAKRQRSSLMQRRIDNFRANKRGHWSLWIFSVLFVLTLFAEFIANDKPLLIYYDGSLYFPIFQTYPETDFGGVLPTATDYSDPYVKAKIEEKGFVLEPLIPYGFNTVAWNSTEPAPAAPNAEHWLGTDDQARDVVARLIYGFRISILFGLPSPRWPPSSASPSVRPRATSAA